MKTRWKQQNFGFNNCLNYPERRLPKFWILLKFFQLFIYRSLHLFWYNLVVYQSKWENRKNAFSQFLHELGKDPVDTSCIKF